jgi:hypothetical protein
MHILDSHNNPFLLDFVFIFTVLNTLRFPHCLLPKLAVFGLGFLLVLKWIYDDLRMNNSSIL